MSSANERWLNRGRRRVFEDEGRTEASGVNPRPRPRRSVSQGASPERKPGEYKFTISPGTQKIMRQRTAGGRGAASAVNTPISPLKELKSASGLNSPKKSQPNEVRKTSKPSGPMGSVSPIKSGKEPPPASPELGQDVPVEIVLKRVLVLAQRLDWSGCEQALRYIYFSCHVMK